MRNLPETIHEYNISRLNVWFIVSSFLLLLCVFWMVWDDYMREWKPFQRQAKQFEAQSLRADRVAAKKKAEAAGYSTVTNKLAQADAFVRQHAGQKAELEKQLERVNIDLSVQYDIYSAAKALLDQRKSEYDEAVELHRKEGVVQKKLRRLRAQEALLQRHEIKVQKIEGEKKDLSEKLSRIVSERERYDKERRRLETEMTLIEKRLGELNNPLLPLVLDMPLVEFAQPTIKVQQVIAEDQTYSINFTEVARIDRCITCHTFTEKKDAAGAADNAFQFASLPQPWRSHPRLDLFVAADSPHPIEKFGCSVCHAGWDRGTKFIHAAHTPAYKPIKEDYVKLPLVEDVPYWAPVSAIEKWKPGLVAKAREHAARVAEREALKSVRAASPEKLRETRAAIQALRTEVQKQFGFDGQALLKFQFASMTQQEAWHQPPLNWHAMHHKEDPMRPREFVESSCLKCHREVTSIPEQKDPTGNATVNPGEKVNAGLRLIEQAGCYACHKMQALETIVKYKVKTGDTVESIAHSLAADPQEIVAYNAAAGAGIKKDLELDVPVRVPYAKPGPSLLKISSKVSREWMLKWLEDPKTFRPNTFMPQFWNLDNNRNGSYFEAAISQSGRMDRAPMKIDWADRNAVEMQAITDYLFKNSDTIRHPAPPPGDVARGEKLVNSVGCMGCHVVDQKLTELEPRDRGPRSQGPMLHGAGSKYDAGWLYAWLKDPAQHRPDTRMPNLRLSNQEAADITAFLMANRNGEFDSRPAPAVKPEVLKDATMDYLKNSMPIMEALQQADKMNAEEQLTSLGEKLVQRYGCMNCHSIKGMENAKPISIELSDWAAKPPSKLDFGFVEIPHDNHAYLHQKLRSPRSFDRVETKKPQELLKMPQFNFTDDQIELIMTAVMGMTGEMPGAKARRNLTENEWYIENGRWLVKEMNCMGCHVIEDHGGALRRTIPLVDDEEQRHLYPPSLHGVGTKVRPAWLQAFLRNPEDHVYRYWFQSRMPTYKLTDDQINTLTQYFALLDKQPYPFESDTMAKDAPAPSKESIAAGEKIVAEAKCMLCHSPRTAEKAAQEANTAVNLSVVKHRMRPKGLLTWLRKASAVTPGVNMPDFWPPDGPNPLPHILNGDSEKQIQAVADYLSVYQASASSPPKAEPPPSKPTPKKQE